MGLGAAYDDERKDRPPGRKVSEIIHAFGANEILDALSAGVLAFRHDGVVTRANRGAARILRRPVSALEGSRIDAIVGPVADIVALAEHESRHEITITLEDGATIALGYSVSRLARPLYGESFVLLFQEISGVLELRRQRDKLLQMAALGDVMPTLLHELRNPLAAVTAMLELLIDDASGTLQADLHAVLNEVRRLNLGLQGIGGLVRTMHSATNCAVDLAVREACRLLEPTVSRRSVRLEAVGPTLPLLPIDRGAVSGVVFNLVRNAVDACPKGGRVVVDAHLEEGDETFVLVVRDDGVGMSPDVLSRCRDLFFTTKDNGSGVGLALCRQVAESSGGTLDVESEPGKGTRVEMRVPLRPPRSR